MLFRSNSSENTIEESENGNNQKYNELNDKYLRLYSDFDNYRKRVIKEKVELSKTASEEVISGLLSVLDDFERAIGALGNNDEDPVKQGILLIYNKFKNTLTQKGLTETDAMGKDFDTDFHEAIANIPAPSEALKNKILDVTQKGYTLNRSEERRVG